MVEPLETPFMELDAFFEWGGDGPDRRYQVIGGDPP